MVQDIYKELGKGEVEKTTKLTESEKITLSVLSMQIVDRTFECNIFRFKKLVERLKATSELDFQMLSKILQQREVQIAEMIMDGKISGLLLSLFRFCHH